MAGKRTSDRRRIVDPRGHRIPLVVRLCESFVDNLATILRIGLVVGSVFLIQELQLLQAIFLPDEAGMPEQQAVSTEAPEPRIEEDPWLTDGVQQALNCTYQQYREENCDECVEEPSEFYRPPTADEDDTGFLVHESPVLFARLDNRPD